MGVFLFFLHENSVSQNKRFLIEGTHLGPHLFMTDPDSDSRIVRGPTEMEHLPTNRPLKDGMLAGMKQVFGFISYKGGFHTCGSPSPRNRRNMGFPWMSPVLKL